MTTVVFLGQQKHALDDKGRVTFPSKYRDALRSPVVIGPGPEGCLRVWAQETYEQQVAQILSKPVRSEKQRDLRRELFSRVSNERIDEKGRMVIPADFRKYASLDEEVVIAGQGDFLELWRPAEWERRMKEVEQNLGEFMDTAAAEDD